MKYSDWRIPCAAPFVPQGLIDAGFTPLLAAVLALRGLSAPEDANAFLRGGDELLLDPMLMRGMAEAVSRIRRAIENRETIAVYGDYDVDGITATCLLTDWLCCKGAECVSYIPDRIGEGYGLNCEAIESLGRKGVKLIITVDCGITAYNEAEFARSIGIDLIITDHHECRDITLPNAVAVIDPKQAQCTYPNKDLAGVGVALKLACAVDGDSRKIIKKYADIAAVGTIADVVPLRGENRYIVRTGLRNLENNARPGLAALIREAGVEERKMNASTIGFSIAPRLNAAGRLGCVPIALNLLMTHDKSKASALASELCDLNRRRQTLENDIWTDALSMMKDHPANVPVVLSSDKWHQGVIGIAASKLAEQYSLPTVMICMDGDKGKGSCRSYGNFNLFDALSACSEHLEGFGGHALAAGLNVRKDKLADFTKAFSEYYLNNRPDELPMLNCDLLIANPDMLDMEGVESLEQLEPFGSGNPKPTMCICGAEIEKIMPIGGGKHLRINVRYGGESFECVFFGHTEEDIRLKEGDIADLAFTPQINEFRLRRTVQLQISEMRRHDPRFLCDRIMSSEEDLPTDMVYAHCPDRLAFTLAWRRIKALGGIVAEDVDGVLRQCPQGLEPEQFCICICVFCELGLMERKNGSAYGASIVNDGAKVRLEDSEIIRKIKDGNGRKH